MSSALGRLVASVVLDNSEFIGGADKAKVAAASMATSVDRTIKDMERSVTSTLTGIAGALAAGFGLNALKNAFDQFVSLRAEIEKISVTTGASVSSISILSQAAKQAGTDLGTVEAALVKMTKGLSASNADTKDTGRALEYLGISGRDAFGQLKDPGDVMIQIAKKLGTMEDGANKTAIALALFGKSGAQMLPTLREVAENGDLVAKVTALQALQAHDLEVAWTRLQVAQSAAGKTVMGELVPSVTALFTVLQQAISGTDGLNASVKSLAATGELQGWAQNAGGAVTTLIETLLILAANVKFVFVGVGEDIGAMMAQMVAFVMRDAVTFERIHQDAITRAEERRKELEDYEKRVLSLSDRYRDQLVLLDLLAKARTGAFGDQASRTAAREETTPFKGTDHTTKTVDQYKLENDQLDKQLARLRGVGELEAYISKLQEERYKNVTPRQKQELIDKEAQILQLEKDKVLREALIKSDEEALKAAQALKDLQVNYTIDLLEQVRAEEFSLSLIGRSADEVAKLTAMRRLDLDLRRQIALLPADVDPAILQNMIRQNEEAKKKVGLIMDQNAASRDQVKVWTEISTQAGNFFADLVMNGKSAFDRLKDQLRSFLQELIALTAKKWFLQLVAGVTGSAGVANAAESAGANTIAGSLYSAAGTYLGSSALGTAAYGLAGMGAGGVPAAYGMGAYAAADSVAINAAAGSYGAGASSLVTLEGGLSSTGYGIIIAAVIAIVAYFATRNSGGPKYGGFSGSSFDADGNLTGSAGAPGTDNNRFFTPNQMDAQLKTVTDKFGKIYTDTLETLGGTSKAFSFLLGVDNDPQGSAQSRVSAGLLGADGKYLYKNVDQNMDDKEVPAAIALEMSRGVLVALQNSDLPAYLSTVFDKLKASTATQEDIDNAMTQALALKSIFDIASRDPLKDVAAGMEATSHGLTNALRQNETAIGAVIKAYDGSLKSTQALQQATIGYYNAQVQLLAGIAQAKAAIDDMFGATFRNIQMAGMDKQGKYDFLRKEAADLQRQALASDDPETIRKLSDRINADIMAAFNLLSPEDQKTQGAAFITQGRDTQTLIDAHLDKIKDTVAAATKTTLDAIKDTITATAVDNRAAATDQVTAANTQLNAARTPRQMIINLPDGTQQVITFDGD